MWTRSAPVGSVAVPALGCGCGGLAWSDVRPIMSEFLAVGETRFYVYEPNGGRP